MRLALPVLLLFSACALADGLAPDAGGAFQDGAMAPDVGLGETDDFSGLRADPDRSAGFAAEVPAETPPGVADPLDGDQRATCYDGSDNDGSGRADCEAVECQGLASCCVGESDCAAGRPALLPAVDFACGDADLATCLAGQAPRFFGSPAPFLDEGGLAPGGDTAYDSGVLLGAPVDLTAERVRVTTTFRYQPCSNLCLESVAVGLTAQPDLSDESHVDAEVALQLAASRERVHLLIGGRIAHAFALDGATDAEWFLELTPDGDVRAGSTRHEEVGASFVPQRDLSLVVWGHSRNPSGDMPLDEERARITSLEITRAACEMPVAWRDRRVLPLFDGVTPLDDQPDRIQAMRRGEEVWLAYRVDANEVRVLREDIEGFATVAPPLLPEWATEWAAIDLADVGGTVHAFAAVQDATGRRYLLDYLWREGSWTAAPESALEASGFPGPLDSLSVLVHRDHTIAAVVDPAGSGRVRLFVRAPGADAFRETGDLDERTLGARSVSLALHGGAYRLHVTSSRGTHDHISLFVSDELLAWRTIEGEVLGESALDTLGARSLSVVEGGEGWLRGFYLGRRGARNIVTEIARPTAPDARFEGSGG